MPSAADLKARYPEFGPVADATVSAVLADAAIASAALPTAVLDQGTIALAAHMLAEEGEPARSRAQSGEEQAATGAQVIKRHKVGDVEVEFEASGAASDGASSGASGYGSTPYGRRWLMLVRTYLGGPLTC